MAVTYQWSVSSMDCAPSEGGKSNVVKVVHWNLSGADGDFSGSVYSSCSLPEPSGSFVSYDSLTQDTVLGWVWANGVDKASAETSVAAQIADKKDPKVVSPALPW